MPPKTEPEERVILGRVGSNLSMGVVGIPNVGKSTFFNVLTKSAIPAENFPFCTIDPNESRVPVPDERFDFLVNHFKPASVAPAWLNITDIAGLVKGAHEGQGLGNAFLSHIRAVDGIFQMLRVFEDEDITHVEGDVNPVRDLEIILEELLLKDIEFVQTRHDQLEAMAKRAPLDKARKEEFEIVKKVLEHVKAKHEVRCGTWRANEIEWLNQNPLLTAKPTVYLVNMSETDYIRKKNKWLVKIKEWVDGRPIKEPLIPFSAAMESKLAGMEPEAAAAYCAEHKVQSQLSKIIKTGYHALDLIHFFTSGEDEVKCWTIKNGFKAPQAAGRIHTDFEKGFICAEVMKFEDFKEFGSESACKANGKYRQEGKNYTMIDGDIVLFKFNVTSAPAKKK